MAVAPIAAVASIASVGMSAYSSYAKGQGDKAAADAQADRLDRAAKYGEVQAMQTAAQSTENLNLKLDNIDAIRAAANIDPSSPTTAAIRSRTSYLANRQESIQVDNIMAQNAQDRSDAEYMRQSGQFALGMGALNAGSSVLKGIGGTNWGSFGVGAG